MNERTNSVLWPVPVQRLHEAIQPLIALFLKHESVLLQCFLLLDSITVPQVPDGEL